MSCTIEYNRKVYIDKSEDSSHPDYLLLIRQGDNNIRETRTGLRAKDWGFISYGWEYQLWQELGERAGSCEGGSLQRAKGFEYANISIEDYIALYRKAIKNAKPIENLIKDFEITFKITKKVKIKDEYDRKKIKESLKKYKFIKRGKYYYDKNYTEYTYPIKSIQDFKDLMKLGKGSWDGDFRTHFHFKRIKS